MVFVVFELDVVFVVLDAVVFELDVVFVVDE